MGQFALTAVAEEVSGVRSKLQGGKHKPSSSDGLLRLPRLKGGVPMSSFYSSHVFKGPLLADSRQPGTTHQRDFLYPGNGKFWLKVDI